MWAITECECGSPGPRTLVSIDTSERMRPPSSRLTSVAPLVGPHPTPPLVSTDTTPSRSRPRRALNSAVPGEVTLPTIRRSTVERSFCGQFFYPNVSQDEWESPEDRKAPLRTICTLRNPGLQRFRVNRECQSGRVNPEGTRVSGGTKGRFAILPCQRRRARNLGAPVSIGASLVSGGTDGMSARTRIASDETGESAPGMSAETGPDVIRDEQNRRNPDSQARKSDQDSSRTDSGTSSRLEQPEPDRHATQMAGKKGCC